MMSSQAGTTLASLVGYKLLDFFDEDHRRHFSLCKHRVKMDYAEIRWIFPKVRAQPWESAEYRGK